MKKALTVFIICNTIVQLSLGQASLPNSPTAEPTAEAREILSLSKKKWTWMANKRVDSLSSLFDENCVFVHMGGSWGKIQELETIKNGNIWYKLADVYGASVNFFGNTAILLNDIDLLAVVGGKEVVHGFMVTEVYQKQNNTWKMGSLTFSTLIRPVKMKGHTQQSH